LVACRFGSGLADRILRLLRLLGVWSGGEASRSPLRYTNALFLAANSSSEKKSLMHSAEFCGFSGLCGYSSLAGLPSLQVTHPKGDSPALRILQSEIRNPEFDLTGSKPSYTLD
jgi:hypothetical protein